MEGAAAISDLDFPQSRRELVGRNVRLGRKLMGMSQDQFAGLVGVTRSDAGKWERGVHEPSARSLVKIAAVLERPAHWFYVDHSEGDA